MAADSVARLFALSALSGQQTDKTITVQQTVGGIEAGTVYAEGTSIVTIIEDLLTSSTPTKVTLYYGATDDVPTSVTGLSSVEVNAETLISDDGYTQHIDSGNTTTLRGQYPVVAIPNTYSLKKWCVPSFEYDIPHTLVVDGNYNIYYLNDVSYDRDIGGIDYLLKIQEV